MELNEYKQLFLEGKKNQNPITGLCGRILRGKTDKDFETLSDDPNRLIIMLMGGDGLEELLGKTGYEALITIGYMRDYIEYKLTQGVHFKLVIFKEGEIAKLATWDNTLYLISQIYPKIRKKIYKQLPLLKNTPFSEIERKAGFKFDEIDKFGPKDKRFMTYKRFKKSKGTLEDVRVFLHHTIHLRELFAGDGFTYNEEGKRGLREYIAPNRKLKELGDYSLIDIAIKLP